MNVKSVWSLFGMMILVSLVILEPEAGFAQPDFMEESRLFPPEYLSKDQTDSSLASLKWQLTQQRTLFDKYKSSRDEISAKLELYSQTILALNRRIPAEIRFIDHSVRSQLVGKAMEQLLNAKLELATMKQSVSSLESKMSESSNRKLIELKEREMELATRTAERRYSLAQFEYEKMKKLGGQGSITQQQVMRAQVSAEIAELEVEVARMRADIEKEEFKVKGAEKLTDKRMDIEPIKARIVAIEEFLKVFSDSANMTAEVGSKKREMELWQQDLQLVAKELFAINRKIDDLETLKNGIETRIKANNDKESK